MDRSSELARVIREGRADVARVEVAQPADREEALIAAWFAVGDGDAAAAVAMIQAWSGDAGWRGRAARLLVSGSVAGLPGPAGHRPGGAALRLALVLTEDRPGEEIRATVLSRAGRTPEAMAALQAACAARPEDVALALRTARALEGYGDAEAALALLPDASPSAEIVTLRAELAASLGGPVAALEEAELGAPEDAVGHATRRARLGDVAAAARLADEAGPAGREVRGWLALWRGDLAAADALLTGPTGRGALAVLRGQGAEALALLETASPGPSPWSGRDVIDAWRASALLLVGRVQEAGRVAEAALAAGEGPTAGTSLTRLATRFAGTAPHVSLPPWAWEIVFRRLAPLGVREVGDTAGALLGEVNRLLGRLAGNRSAVCTVADPDLTVIPLPPVPRAEARRAQLLLRTRPAAEVLARLEALAAAHPDEETPWTYRGEVLLWSGRYAESEACFREALARNVRATWGWIGLGAARMLLGDLDGAAATWRQATDQVRVMGPTMYIYRGEAAWRAGRYAEARVDLRQALADKPQRLATHVVHALNEAALGDRGPAARVVAEIGGRSPGAAAVWQGEDDVARLLWLLERMRGNRSSALPAFIDGDAWWFLSPWAARVGPPGSLRDGS
jgi:tetratricopeptide (TPR) repeat protein